MLGYLWLGRDGYDGVWLNMIYQLVISKNYSLYVVTLRYVNNQKLKLWVKNKQVAFSSPLFVKWPVKSAAISWSLARLEANADADEEEACRAWFLANFRLNESRFSEFRRPSNGFNLTVHQWTIL